MYAPRICEGVIRNLRRALGTGFCLTAVVLAGCDKVPTFDELTGKDQKAEDQAQAPITPETPGTSAVPEQPATPPTPPKADPATVIAKFRALQPSQVSAP